MRLPGHTNCLGKGKNLAALLLFDVESGGEAGGDGAIRLGVSNEIRDLAPCVGNCADVERLLGALAYGSEGKVCIFSR